MSRVRQYADFEAMQNQAEAQRRKQDDQAVKCPTCGSEWFEQVRCYRYQASHNIILGQEVPVRPGSVGYVLLKCVCCGDALEPRILHNTRDIAGGDYDYFLDTLEGKFDLRKGKEPTPPSVMVDSEEL